MKRILIVEDDSILAEIYERQFRADGYDVSLANDGDRALKTIDAENFDLVLLDLMLIPTVGDRSLSGLDVLQHIRSSEKTKAIPVVVLSNLSEDSTIKKALSMGANGYLKKVDYLPQQAVAEVKKFLA